MNRAITAHAFRPRLLGAIATLVLAAGALRGAENAPAWLTDPFATRSGTKTISKNTGNRVAIRDVYVTPASSPDLQRVEIVVAYALETPDWAELVVNVDWDGTNSYRRVATTRVVKGSRVITLVGEMPRSGRSRLGIDALLWKITPGVEHYDSMDEDRGSFEVNGTMHPDRLKFIEVTARPGSRSDSLVVRAVVDVDLGSREEATAVLLVDSFREKAYGLGVESVVVKGSQRIELTSEIPWTGRLQLNPRIVLIPYPRRGDPRTLADEEFARVEQPVTVGK